MAKKFKIQPFYPDQKGINNFFKGKRKLNFFWKFSTLSGLWLKI